MKDKIALMFFAAFLLFAPVSQAGDNTIGTQYEGWNKGITLCLPNQQLQDGLGCLTQDGQALTFDAYVQAALGPKGYLTHVTGLDIAPMGITIRFVFRAK